MAKITIAELDLDVNSLIKSTADVKAVIDQLKEAQKQLTKEGDTASDQFIQNSADLKVLNSAYNSNLKAIADSTNAKAEETNRTDLLNIAIQAEATSIKEAREQNSLLNKLRNETNVTTAEGKAELDALNKKLDENNDFIKENADQYLKQKINIGNYSDSIKEALNDLNPLNGGLTGFIARSKEAGGVLPLVTNGLKAVTVGIGGMIRASLTFLATPIGAVIGAIGLVLGLLVNYLKSTQAGIDAVTAVTRPLQAIFQSLIGVLQNVGKFLFDAFNDPKKTLIELADFVKQNLINRFTAFAEILEGIIELDFKKVTNGVLQAGTGVENLTGKIQDGAKQTAKFLEDAAKKGAEIDSLTKQIEKSEINLNKEREIGNTRIKELEKITKDTSANIADRLKANKEQNEIAKETEAGEQRIINLKIQRLKIEQSLNDTSREGNKELADLESELEKSKQRVLEEELKGARVIATANKQAQAEAEQRAKAEADRRQKALDDAVKLQKAEIDLFLSSQGIRAKSLEQNLKLAEDVNKKQIELAQLEFNASAKTQADKLALKTAINSANDALLQEQTNLVIANTERELQLFKEANQSKLDNSKFLTTELVQNEINRLNLIAEEEANAQTLQLQNGVINEQQYQDAIKQIDDKFEAERKAVEQEKAQADLAQQAIDLENKRIVEDLIFQDGLAIKQQRLEAQRQIELENAKKTGADLALINQKFALKQAELENKANIAKVNSFQNALGQIGSLLNAFGIKNKNLAIALAFADTFLGATKAYISQLIPGDPTSIGRAVFAGAQATAFGLANVAKVASTDTKFKKGGIQEIGGNLHSSGGTKFIGSDGTSFEAERGELIGVMNRNASSKFMSFNNAFGSKGSIGTSYAQTGGIIARGMNSGQQDLEQLADLTAQAVSSMPTPIVTVEDINRVATRVNVIENGANFG
jgi:hypothetical protein